MKQFKHSYILLIITLFLCQHVYADDNVSVPTVAAVQGLVIVSDRRGFEPVKVGMRLMKGDEIKTGKRGKVYIDFPDNSRVKLGVNSRFKIKDWYKRKGIFYSTLSIICTRQTIQ